MTHLNICNTTINQSEKGPSANIKSAAIKLSVQISCHLLDSDSWTQHFPQGPKEERSFFRSTLNYLYFCPANPANSTELLNPFLFTLVSHSYDVSTFPGSNDFSDHEKKKKKHSLM